MKVQLKSAAAGVAALAVAGGFALALAGSASAATSPTYEPDPNSLGTVMFMDSSGNQITSGTLDGKPFAASYEASSAAPDGTLKARAYFYTPQQGQAPATWQTSDSTSASQTATPGTAPTVFDSGSKSLSDHIVNFPNATTSDPNIYQLRIVLNPSAQYWATDVQVDTAKGTWTQIYPTVVAQPKTTTTVSANPSTVTTGQSTTLTATVKDQDGAAVNDGTVQFQDGATNIGSPVNVSGGSASTNTSFTSAGDHAIKAVYSSTNSAHPTSTGTTTVTVAKAAAKATSTALSVSGNVTTAGQGGTLTATVTDGSGTPVSAGSVAFYDNGSTTPLSGAASNSGNSYTLTLSSPDFVAGGHSIVAKFTPTSTDDFAASQSAPSTFTTLAASDPCAGKTQGTCDTQTITGTIPPGSITITTPYTDSNPLDLGNLALTSDGTMYTGSATFKNIVVTDTRSGAQPWTAKALSSNLTSGANVINSQNVGLTGVTGTPSAGFAGTVTYTDNPAANPAVGPTDPGNKGLGGTTAHTFAAADHGPGTVTMDGKLTLNAPTSAQAGKYKGTITFTVG